ncbi:MAG: hypothetical protein VZR56_11845 [Treponema sp.]|nr:hypothetical protein [Treponema sp.]
MKKFALPLLATILLTGGGIFTSCENFLDGAEIKEKIESQIAYANAPAYTIRVDCPENSGIIKSPTGGEISKKVTDVFTVRFEPASDREFIRWRVLDIATGNEVTDDEYLVLSALTDSETECTFKKAPEGEIRLSLEPVIVERPQILSYTPLFETNGVNKDSAIQVIFDYDLNEDSIYFTDDEVYKWENTNGVTLLPPENVNGRERYYGYKKDGKTFFKNISITNNETGENLNDYFSAPMFENPHRLSISVKKNSAGNALLPPWTQVLVSLERGFFYKVDDKPVCMTAGKKWIYQVTNSEDKTSPGVVSNEVKLVTSTGTTTLTALSAVPSSPWSSASVPYANIKQLSINLKVKDTGSGPADSFLVNFKRVGTYDDSTYHGWTATTAREYPSKSVSYQSVMGENAECNKTLDFSDLNLADGVYALSLEFKDKSGNSFVYPTNGNKFYFNIDTQAPIVIYPSNGTQYQAATKSATSSIKLEWNKDSGYSKDLKQTTIWYKKRTESTYAASATAGTGVTEKTVTGLQDNTLYDFKIIHEDFNGNTTEPSYFERATLVGPPNPPTNLRKKSFTPASGATPPKITVMWDEPVGDYDACFITISWWINKSNGALDMKNAYQRIPKGTTQFTQELTGGSLANYGIDVTLHAERSSVDMTLTSENVTKTFNP